MHFPRILSGRSQYTQHLPPWSGPLWLGAATLITIDHIYCSSLHNHGIVRTAPSYAAATQRILALMVEFCLMAANISVIYHVSRMLASRKTRQNFSIFAYLVPIFVLLIITAINVILTTIPLIAPNALVTVSAAGSAEALYNYSPSLIMLGFAAPLLLVGLCILAGGILIWAYGPSSCGDERADLYDMAWQSPNVRVQV
ncbi:hypothetical protein FRC11_014216 [Ceratobasidium sp. 423]|nr:hypothetical protein FRC11_014216 [Ceratobasidium sp. 423]